MNLVFSTSELSLVLAAFSIVGLVAFIAIVAGSTALGLLLGKRFARRNRAPGEPEVSLREGMRRSQARLRRELTPGERRFFYGYALVSPLSAPAGIVLLVFGSHGVRGVGIGLLLLALVMAAVPISPILRARIRRREQGSDAGRHASKGR